MTGLDYFGARYYGPVMGRFTSPDGDGIDQHPIDPQSWNLYTYGRNSPLRFLDPTGGYVCGATVDEKQCRAFEEARGKALDLASGLKGKEHDEAIRAIEAFGEPGIDNGVTIEIGGISNGMAGGVDPQIGSAAKTEDNPLGQRITVRFSDKVLVPNSAAEASKTLAHEGSHVADGSDFVRSGFNPARNPTNYNSELRAFRVEQSLVAISDPIGPRGYVNGSTTIYTWMPGWSSPGMIDIGINAVLRSRKFPYHLTPKSRIKSFVHNTQGGH